MKKNKKRRKKLVAGTIAAATSAAILVGSSVTSNDEFLRQQNNNKEDHIMVIEEAIPENIQETFAMKICHAIPDIIKYCIVIPLWIAAHLLLKMIKALILGVLSPIISFIVHLLLLFILILLIIVICVKLMFPERPIKDILTKKLVIGVFIGCFLIELGDVLLPKVWQEFTDYRYLFQFVGGLIIVTIALIPYIKEYVKLKHEPQIIIPEGLLN